MFLVPLFSDNLPFFFFVTCVFIFSSLSLFCSHFLIPQNLPCCLRPLAYILMITVQLYFLFGYTSLRLLTLLIHFCLRKGHTGLSKHLEPGGEDFGEEEGVSRMWAASGKPLNERMILLLESYYIHRHKRPARLVWLGTLTREIDLQLVCEKCHFPDDFLSCYKVWLWLLAKCWIFSMCQCVRHLSYLSLCTGFFHSSFF